MRWLFLLCLTSTACATAPADELDSLDRTSTKLESQSAGGVSAPVHTPIVLRRSDIERTVAQGLGVFLGTVDLEPELQRGQFVGFRLAGTHTAEPWSASGIDIEVGDVIERVNGVAIVRPEHAQLALERCRGAEVIEVQLVRAGVRRVVKVPIEVDR